MRFGALQLVKASEQEHLLYFRKRGVVDGANDLIWLSVLQSFIPELGLCETDDDFKKYGAKQGDIIVMDASGRQVCKFNSSSDKDADIQAFINGRKKKEKFDAKKGFK